MAIYKKDGVTYIDGTPLHEIGALVARKGIVGAPRDPAPETRRHPSQEWALCRGCRKEKPTTDFHGHLFKDARGYVGKCKACAQVENVVPIPPPVVDK